MFSLNFLASRRPSPSSPYMADSLGYAPLTPGPPKRLIPRSRSLFLKFIFTITASCLFIIVYLSKVKYVLDPLDSSDLDYLDLNVTLNDTSSQLNLNGSNKPPKKWPTLPPVEGNPRFPNKEGFILDSKQAFGKNGAVATDEARCSEIGISALRDGGSAVDAAIASALCIGLLNSFSSGIGGGGFMLVRKPDGDSELIDFREVAPAAATKNMFTNNSESSQFGGLSIAVPAELKGFELAHKRFGKLKWSRLFEPTIKLARDGYKVGKILAIHLNETKIFLKNEDGFSDAFFDLNGNVLKEGDVSKRVNFANTLQMVADHGADVFYQSELTSSMVNTIRKNGGILTLEDFKSYTPVIRKTLSIDYNGFKIITGPPPTSGPILASIFNVLEGYNLKDIDIKPLNIHRMIEAFKFGYSQRTRLGDPSFVNVNPTVQDDLSKGFASSIRDMITDNSTHSFEYYNPIHDISIDHGTTHLSILDKDGMAVSLTSTINLLFGSLVMDKSTGVIFNDHMDDFSTPKVKNAFGLYPSPNNYIVPGKRPMSTTSAVIVEKDGDVELVLGASGGSKILTSTTQVLLNVLEFNKTLKEAIDAPRLHHQLLPEFLLYEPFYPKSILEFLSQRNHTTAYMNQGSSVVQGVRRFPNGTYNSVSDDRKFGAPAAF
ncbi:Gamma-glutamyltranspeptidase 1 [Smittium mucronatum]|uniref:Glutathione hydrolase n=1 Tax=Smittium mucronatum TaxID=133383 RepID=A0A1R0GSC6_9FUNG|nr:Gamma-glutamyltranspeptidase 1 [Smittium mucronatum]